MTTTLTSQSHCVSTIVFAAILSFVGCNRGPEIVPVAGKITIDGQPLATGIITLYQSGFRPATAKIESDGSFVFKTLKDRDGCLLGEHPITVSSNEVISGTTTKFFIPDHYANVNVSDMKIKIDGATDKLEIKLTWAGSSHNAPYIMKASGEGT